MPRHFPVVAVLLGVAGLLPFLGCGVAALGYLPDQAALAEAALVAYGAVILGFLGGVHWGQALDAGPGVSDRANRNRYLLSVMPALVGWAAVLLSLALALWVGLATLIAGFVATTLVEARATRAGLMPRAYMWLRWALTVVVVLTLAAVMALKLAGAHAEL
jgi:hypothetical protein